MKYDHDKHHRQSTRLREYDYSSVGAYFVTICSHNHQCLFGRISEGRMILNDAGKFANKCWLEIPGHSPHVKLDKYIIMPNHIHGIIIIEDVNVGANNYSPLQINQFRSPFRTIGSIIRGFKIGVTKWFRANTNVYNVWQRNYYEHVIRNESKLNKIREYIINNPLKWHLDRENPERTGNDTLEDEIFGNLNDDTNKSACSSNS